MCQGRVSGGARPHRRCEAASGGTRDGSVPVQGPGRAGQPHFGSPKGGETAATGGRSGSFWSSTFHLGARDRRQLASADISDDRQKSFLVGDDGHGDVDEFAALVGGECRSVVKAQNVVPALGTAGELPPLLNVLLFASGFLRISVRQPTSGRLETLREPPVQPLAPAGFFVALAAAVRRSFFSCCSVSGHSHAISSDESKERLRGFGHWSYSFRGDIPVAAARGPRSFPARRSEEPPSPRRGYALGRGDGDRGSHSAAFESGRAGVADYSRAWGPFVPAITAVEISRENLQTR